MASVVGPIQRHFLDESSTSNTQVEMTLGLLRLGREIDSRRGILLRPAGLSEGRLGALLAIHSEPGISPAHLAQRLNVTRATVTGLLDGLERAGNIERHRVPSDRRMQKLHLSRAGEATMRHGIALVSSFLGELTATIPSGDVAVTFRTLEALWSALEHREEAP